jgi:hypothetical protein|tara:strand:- start:712 stop:870 length:159 start_codon:yes stop_codon:yes gene_type:complete
MWIIDRIKEASTHNGLIVAAGAATVLFLGIGLMDVVLYGAIVWGVWSMIRTD